MSRRAALAIASMAAFGAAVRSGAASTGIARVALSDLPIGAASDMVKPGAAWATQLWGGALLVINEHDRLVPGIASLDIVSADRSTLQLTARVGALFADGTPVLAEDMRQSVLFAKDRCEAGGEGWRFEYLDAVRVTDRRTVQIALTEPDASFVTTLASHRVPVVPASWVAQGVQAESLPTASGGFTRVGVDGATIECRRSSTFYQIGRPHLAGIRCLAPDDTLSRAMRLVTGQCDLVVDVPLLDVPTLRENPGFHLVGGPARNLCYLICNLSRSPMNDARVRSIVSRSIDRAEIVRNATAGEATIAESLIPPDHWAGLNEPLASLTPEDARVSLRDLGFESETQIRLIVDPGDVMLVNAGVTLQNQLAYAGIAVQLDLTDQAHVDARVEHGDWDIWLVRSPYWNDPHELVRPLLVTNGSLNKNRYANRTIDYQVALARRSQPARRASWYRSVEEIIRRDLPVIPLIFPFSYDAMTPAISNYPLFSPISARAMIQAEMISPGTIATP